MAHTIDHNEPEEKTFSEKVEERANELADNVSSDLGYYAAKMVASKDYKEPITSEERAKYTLLGAFLGAAPTILLPKRIFPNKIRRAFTSGLTSAATGYYTPEIVRLIRKRKAGEISSKDAKLQIRELSKKKFMDKEAALGGILGLAGRYVGRPAKRFVKSPVGKKTIGAGVVGGTVVGVPYAGYKAYQSSKAPRSGRNYNTFLRNNILAGRINQNELSNADLVSVRQLGLK